MFKVAASVIVVFPAACTTPEEYYVIIRIENTVAVLVVDQPGNFFQPVGSWSCIIVRYYQPAVPKQANGIYICNIEAAEI